MSVLVTNLIDRALLKSSDPGARRNSRPLALQCFNEVQEEIAIKLKCLEDDYYFALEASQEAYSYPVDSVQIKGIRVTQNTSPTGLQDYYWLDEQFDNEFRAATNLMRPSGYVWGYVARPSWFELLMTPPADISDGGIVTAYRIPTWITTETPQATMELPDFCRVHVQRGMEILMKYANRELAEGDDQWKQWKLDLEQLEQPISDRSMDRRASVRPPGGLNFRGAR